MCHNKGIVYHNEGIAIVAVVEVLWLLQVDYSSLGIRVNCICAGTVEAALRPARPPLAIPE